MKLRSLSMTLLLSTSVLSAAELVPANDDGAAAAGQVAVRGAGPMQRTSAADLVLSTAEIQSQLHSQFQDIASQDTRDLLEEARQVKDSGAAEASNVADRLKEDIISPYIFGIKENLESQDDVVALGISAAIEYVRLANLQGDTERRFQESLKDALHTYYAVPTVETILAGADSSLISLSDVDRIVAIYATLRPYWEFVDKYHTDFLPQLTKKVNTKLAADQQTAADNGDFQTALHLKLAHDKIEFYRMAHLMFSHKPAANKDPNSLYKTVLTFAPVDTAYWNALESAIASGNDALVVALYDEWQHQQQTYKTFPRNAKTWAADADQHHKSHKPMLKSRSYREAKTRLASQNSGTDETTSDAASNSQPAIAVLKDLYGSVALDFTSLDALQASMKAVYRSLALRLHPDKVQPADKPAAELSFKELGAWSSTIELLTEERFAQWKTEHEAYVAAPAAAAQRTAPAAAAAAAPAAAAQRTAPAAAAAATPAAAAQRTAPAAQSSNTATTETVSKPRTAPAAATLLLNYDEDL